MNKFNKFFHIFATTLIVIILTLFIPTTVNTVDQERNIQFGYPVSFVSMNYSDFSMVEIYNEPFTYYLANPRQHPTYIIWKNFSISFLLWFMLISVTFLLFSQFLKNYRHFEIFLNASLFLLMIIAFFKFPFEIVILLLFVILITQLLNEYTMQTK